MSPNKISLLKYSLCCVCVWARTCSTIMFFVMTKVNKKLHWEFGGKTAITATCTEQHNQIHKCICGNTAICWTATTPLLSVRNQLQPSSHSVRSQLHQIHCSALLCLGAKIAISNKRKHDDNICILFNENVIITNDKKSKKKQKMMINIGLSKKRKFNNIQ